MVTNQFSVLISVYFRERAEFLRTSLESVFNQTMPPSEVILVKDGPLTEELDKVTDDFAERYADKLKIVALSTNVGLGNALNEGLKHCSYQLVARMDSDDICLPNRFEMQINKFKSEPTLSIVGGWISEFVTDPNKIESVRKLPENHLEILSFARSKSPFNHPSVMFKKSDIIEIGGYQHFYLLEDYWLWARLLAAGKMGYNIQQVLVNMRGGIAMSARRGGWKYAKSEINLQNQLYKLKLISYPCMLKNICIRFTVRMMPNKLRAILYTKFLRS